MMMKRMLIMVLMLCQWTLPALVSALTNPKPPPVTRDAEIREAVEMFVRQKTGNAGLDVVVKRIAISGKVTLPPGATDYEIVAPQQWEGWGAVSLAVVARQDGVVIRNIPVRVEVESLADMVVAVRQIEANSTISTADLTIQKRDIATAGGRFAKAVSEVAGKKNRTTIRANASVRIDQLEKIPLVKPGQMVTIIAENEVIKITVSGKVKSPGAEGDTVMVQNLNSLKELPARVINATTVQVSF